MDEQWPVVVVGGGFAGLAAARACACEGVDCLVLEQSDEVGYPIHTSGGSFLPDLQRLGIPDELYHPIDRLRFQAPTEAATFRYDEPHFCVMDVRDVRQYLARRALDAGASLWADTTVTDAVVEDDGVSGVVARRSGSETTVRADVVVDASGFSSVVAQRAGLHEGFDRFGRGREYDLYAPEFDQREARLVLGETYAPAGYGWLFPHGDGRVRVGVGSLYPDAEGTGPLGDSLDALVERYADEGLDAGNQLEVHSGVIPSAGVVDRSVADGLVCVGDAAGQPLGLVGEGIRVSLETGELAGVRAADAVGVGRRDGAFLAGYEDRWRERYERRLRIADRINRHIATFDDDQWDEGVALLRDLTPAQTYRLLKCDFEPGLLAGLVASNPGWVPKLARHLLGHRFGA